MARRGGTGSRRRQGAPLPPPLAEGSKRPSAVTHNKKLMAMAAERDRRLPGLGAALLGSQRRRRRRAGVCGDSRGAGRGGDTARHRLPPARPPSPPPLSPWVLRRDPQPRPLRGGQSPPPRRRAPPSSSRRAGLRGASRVCGADRPPSFGLSHQRLKNTVKCHHLRSRGA